MIRVDFWDSYNFLFLFFRLLLVFFGPWGPLRGRSYYSFLNMSVLKMETVTPSSGVFRVIDLIRSVVRKPHP